MTDFVQSLILSLGWMFGLDILAVINSLTTNRTFGVEIELINLSKEETKQALVNAGIPCKNTEYTHDVPEGFWRVVTDGSLENDYCRVHRSGCTFHTAEIVSPILRGVSGLIEIVRVIWALKRAGADANHSCGIHVHVDAPEFWGKWSKVRQILTRYVGLGLSKEDKALRPYSGYAKSVDNPDEMLSSVISDEFNYKQNKYNLKDLYRNGDRYFAVNYCAMYKHRTIEYRQLAGTFNLMAILKWIVAVVSLTEECSSFEGCHYCNDNSGENHDVIVCYDCETLHCSESGHGQLCECPLPSECAHDFLR